MVTRTTSEDATDFVAPDELNFDLSNPRFADEERFATEEDIVRYLTQHVDVDELLQSIQSAGYVDFEPLIVQREGRIVLEGNRRLAALRLLSDESLRERLRVRLPEVNDPKALPDRIRVKWVDNRTDARDFIGFKHINGPFKWDALAKAKFAAEWFESGGNIATISRTLGDSHNTVRRLVNGWYALKQASEDDFDKEDRSKPRFAFSHLYTALTRASVREFLGLTPEDLSAPPRPNPVPPERRIRQRSPECRTSRRRPVASCHSVHSAPRPRGRSDDHVQHDARQPAPSRRTALRHRFDRFRIAHFADACLGSAGDESAGVDGRDRFNDVETWVRALLEIPEFMESA